MWTWTPDVSAPALLPSCEQFTIAARATAEPCERCGEAFLPLEVYAGAGAHVVHVGPCPSGRRLTFRRARAVA